MKLSIITVNLNNREGLRKTAQSILDQTFTDYEWIVVDGASTDGSVEVANEFAQKINAKSSTSSIITPSPTIISSPIETSSSNNPLTPTALVISEPDTGIYNAMNKGIRKAQGEYCFFLNSGDYIIDRNALNRVFAISFSEDVIHGNVLFNFGDRTEVRNTPETITLRTFVEKTINHSGCAFIRHSAFEKWGLYDENLKIVSDWKWFLQTVGLGCATIKYIDYYISVFDVEGISNQNKQLLYTEREFVLKELLPPRVLQDYIDYAELEESKYRQEQQIRSSAPYVLGKLLIDPFKKCKLFLHYLLNVVSNFLCCIYLFFLRKRYRIPSKTKDKEEKIIVSLTSWIRRIDNVPIVIESILKNTILPDKIVLNLSLEEFPNRELDLPLAVQEIINNHTIEVIWNLGNTKAFKKIIPTMDKYPNDAIISIDDDYIYPKDFIETFVKKHKQFPHSPLSGNNYLMSNVQGHCGCASLVKREYYGSFLDVLLTDEIINIGMDDIFFPFCAALNGYYYTYVGVSYPDVLRSLNPTDCISHGIFDDKNRVMQNAMVNNIKKMFKINYRNLNYPTLSFSAIFHS